MLLYSTRAFITIPVLYLCFGGFLYIAQHHFLYIPNNHPFGDCPNAPTETISLELSDWRGYYTPSPESSSDRIVVLYHGNAGNACHRTALITSLQTHGHAVLIIEYPGFADPHTSPTTRTILETIPHIQHHLRHTEYDHTTVVGESIGSGFASYHAATSESPVDLILITPFARLSDLVQERVLIYPVRWLLQADLTVADWSQAATSVTIISAEADQIIPTRHTDRLHAALPATSTTRHTIPNTDHNSLYTAPQFHTALRTALE